MSRKSDFPAFPLAIPDESDFCHGMSLRDYFAAKAMHAILEMHVGGAANVRINVDAKGTAEKAYQMADAMLAQREAAA